VFRFQPHARCAQFDLLHRLFSRDVERRTDMLRKMGSRLKQQAALANPRFTADQHHAAGYQTAAQHAGKLTPQHRQAHKAADGDIAQTHRAALHTRNSAATARRHIPSLGLFNQAVPCSTIGASAHPARLL